MNRRGGNFGGGQQRGFNRPSNYNNQPSFQSRGLGGVGGGGSNLSPWQGGGGGNNQGGGALLNQITSNPQLALAITSLLQPQQQQPPSLLSLNTGSNNSFSNNRGFGGPGSGSRFGSNSGPLNRNNRDFRRPDSYNKNRGGFGDRRQPFKKKSVEDKKKAEIKAEKKDDDTEDGNEEEKKRDWKDEKNTGEGGEEGKNKDGKYAGVPRKYLKCFVCNKKMWDGESMGKHVRGRAHHEMLKAMEESIQLCVSVLRENLRLTEERRLIEYNRQNRWHKFDKRREAPMSHCAMCDLKFLGKIIRHRRTDGHQRLKNYLHPTCTACDKEYPSRMDWVEHCLTPEHLRKAHGHEMVEGDTEAAAPTDADADTTEDAPAGTDTTTDAVATPESKEEVKEVFELALDPLLEENLHLESDEPILDLDTPQENKAGRLPTSLPAYKPNRPLAMSCLKEFSGWRCELCCKSFTSAEDGEAHLSTKKHFLRFSRHVKKLYDIEEKKKAAAAKKAEEEKAEKDEKKEEGEDGDQEMYDPTEATEEEEGKEEVNGEEEDAKMDTSVEEVKPKQESKPEPQPPATPRASARKAVGGPKGKRGGKK